MILKLRADGQAFGRSYRQVRIGDVGIKQFEAAAIRIDAFDDKVRRPETTEQIVEGVTEFEGVTGLDHLLDLFPAQAPQVAVRKGVFYFQLVFESQSFIEEVENGVGNTGEKDSSRFENSSASPVEGANVIDEHRGSGVEDDVKRFRIKLREIAHIAFDQRQHQAQLFGDFSILFKLFA